MITTPIIADLQSVTVERTFAPIAADVSPRHDVVEHYSNDSASTAWLREMRAMETEGERTPAQPDIQIRADFPRGLFCLYCNGEPVGVSSQYKVIELARRFLIGELS